MPKKKFPLRMPSRKKAESISSAKYSSVYRANILAETKRKIFSRSKTPEEMKLAEFLEKIKSGLSQKGITPAGFQVIFVRNAMEMVSVLPEKDYFRNYLIEQKRKDSSYEFSPDKPEFIFRGIYSGKGKTGGIRLSFIVFAGKSTPGKKMDKQLKRMAKMMADPEYRIKIESRISDKKRIAEAFYGKRKKNGV